MLYSIAANDQRAADRVCSQLSMDFTVCGRTDHGLIHDLSERGLFVCTKMTPSLGSRIYMILQFGKSGTIRLMGRVRRLAQFGQSLLPGLGVEFDGVGMDVTRRIENYVRDQLTKIRGFHSTPVPETPAVAPTPLIRQKAELSVRRSHQVAVADAIDLSMFRDVGSMLVYSTMIALPIVAGLMMLSIVGKYLSSIGL